MQKKLIILIAILLLIFGAIIVLIETLEEKVEQSNVSLTGDQDINKEYTYIHEIQGIGHISPLNGKEVKNVYGIVTVAGPTFYIIQTPTDSEDEDLRTSEAIKVRAQKNHGRAKGELILVDGTVDEVRPRNYQKIDEGAPTLTQLRNPSNVRVLKKTEMPVPVIIGQNGRALPDKIISEHTGSIETSDFVLNLDYGLDLYESLESMLVQVNNALVVSPIDHKSVFITPDNGKNSSGVNARGSIAIADDDNNPEIIKVMSGFMQKRLPNTCETGDSLGTVIGTVDFNWGNYTIYTTEDFQYTNNTLKRESLDKACSPGHLKVAAFNVLNLDARDSYERFNDLAQIIVENLNEPDILVLEEIQDNNGASAERVGKTGSAADKTFGKLITAIKQAKGPSYRYAQIDPVYDQDGGEPHGNIRVGFLFNPARVKFYERGKKYDKSITPTEVVEKDQSPRLTLNPGRIDPQNEIWRGSRRALVGEFIFNDKKVFVIGVHLPSKGGDASIWSWNQNQAPASEARRSEKAELVRDFASKITEIDENALVLIAGDFNDFHFRKPLTLFKDAGFINPAYKLDPNDRYSMIYQGNAQLLDHILVSKAYSKKIKYDIVHVNSEFINQASDHDPVYALIDMSE